MAKIVIAAVIIGVLTFVVGFGFDMSDDRLSGLQDALISGIEAVVAACIAMMVGVRPGG